MMLGTSPFMMKGGPVGPVLPIPTTWVSQSSGTANRLNAVAANGSFVVAVGINQTVIRSIDGGVTWSLSTGGFASGDVQDVIFGGGNFVANGLGANTGNKVRYSGNGSSFSAASHPWGENANVYGSAYGLNNFISIAAADIPRSAISSNVAGPFTASATPPTFTSAAVGASPTGHVIVGGSGGEMAISSDDGNTFTSVSSPFTARINKIRWGNGTFIAVGYSGQNYKSTDNGATWTSAGITTSNVIFSAHYYGGVWVAVGNNGFIAYSIDDMATWVTMAPPYGSTIFGITFSDNKWVFVGNSGVVYTSVV